MRLSSRLKGNPKRSILGVLCCATLALMSGSSVTGSATWQVGDLVVCVGSGQCRIYPGSGGSPTTISVPQSPKKETGEPAWSSAFALYVVDAWNQKVQLFDKTDPHALLQEIDTAAKYSPGVPGSLAVNSAGDLFVAMKNADVILRYDRHGVFQEQINVVSDNAGGVDWIALADDNNTLWYTSGSDSLQRFDLSSKTNGSPIPLNDDGVAGGLRILPFRYSFNPADAPDLDDVNGSNGILVADGVDIKLVVGGTVTKTYDVSSADEEWRALTLHPDGRTFVAATASGAIYSFEIEGSGTPVGSPILTGSTQVSGLSFHGGNQLNIRSAAFDNTGTAAIADVQQVAVFGNPLAGSGDPWPRHLFGIRIPTLPANTQRFWIAISANWAESDWDDPFSVPDGCPNGETPETDYDCRARLPSLSMSDPLPRCIPYVSGSKSDCVFYRADEGDLVAKGITVQSVPLQDTLVKLVDFHTPGNGYVPDPCTMGVPNTTTPKGNPRMLFVKENGAAFTDDITIGAAHTASDPIFGGGTGRSGSDYGIFDRCLELGGARLEFLKPVKDGIYQLGRSLPFEVKVFRFNPITGQEEEVTDALDGTKSMALFILHNGTGDVDLELETPGGSSPFAKKRGGYGANWDTTGKAEGQYTACVSSTDLASEGAGLFDTKCLNFSLVPGKK